MIVSIMTIEIMVPKFYSNIASCYNKNLPSEFLYPESNLEYPGNSSCFFFLLIQVSYFLYHLGIFEDYVPFVF